jgi:stringent starvation protein B
MLNTPDSNSTRPYLLRALHEWCCDSGLTPYVAVLVDETVQVPMEYVKNGEIVLNVSYEATSGMHIGNDFIEFKARFAGVPREIIVPVNRVLAIYARENGQGMAFPMSVVSGTAHDTPTGVVTPVITGAPDDDTPPKPPAGTQRPALKRVK